MAQIEANYEVDENDMLELRKIVSKNAVTVKVDDAEPENVEEKGFVFDEPKKEGDASNEI